MDNERYVSIGDGNVYLAKVDPLDIDRVWSMLGHFDAGFTLRTYTHATRQKQDEAAAAMGSFMEQVR